LLLSVILSGCITRGPLPEAPGIDLPDQWEATLGNPDASFILDLSDVRVSAFDFSTTPIPELIQEALEQSPFLQSTQALAKANSAGVEVIRGQRRPRVLGRFQVNRQKQNLGSNPTFGRLFGGGTFIFEHYTSDLALNWEIDLWGRLKDLENAAVADFEAAQQDLEAARLSIAAQVARAWISLTGANLRQELTAGMVKSHEANLAIIENRFQQGLASALDLRLTQASLTSARASLESQARMKAKAGRHLETLLARYPSGRVAPGQDLPKTGTRIPAGLPAKLLAQRPDIQSAHQRLRAAGFREREAGKGFLPNISLTGASGTASQNIRELTDSSFSSWNLLGNLAQPILDGGRIRARMRQTQAFREKAAADYRSTLLNALREVENTLDAEGHLTREESALRQAADEFAQAETLAWERYRKGLADIITTLEAQRRANEARARHLAIKTERIHNRIQLHLALGIKLQGQDAQAP